MVMIPSPAVVDRLISMQVLMPKTTTHHSTFVLWLAQWGLVLSAITKAQKRIIHQLKRSHYKELSQATFETQSFPGGLAGSFVLHTLTAQGQVGIKKRPVGNFVQLVRQK
uniref:Uncharacterized protein n=1 Tax=Cyclophora tenuis TaxID=216820 RepID=A0A7S1D548_CYCTE|mmetsp:Transcript_20652/g.35230  ORF Transcript_20652/g.35230 Transcript_20652/m.35230 type:complete len:110 (+) Transcript_20652:233-562(+)